MKAVNESQSASCIKSAYSLIALKYSNSQWRRPGAKFGGVFGHFFRRTRFLKFLNDVFGGEKFPFSRQKFLMTFFIDQIFQIFPFFFQMFPMFAMLDVIFDPFLTRKTPLFTLFILSRASDNTTSLNIGGTNAWAVPHLKLWGAVPPRSPPLQSVPYCNMQGGCLVRAVACSMEIRFYPC